MSGLVVMKIFTVGVLAFAEIAFIIGLFIFKCEVSEDKHFELFSKILVWTARIVLGIGMIYFPYFAYTILKM